MKVSKVAEMFTEQSDQDAEVCISWWSKDLFDDEYKDSHDGALIPDEIWNIAVAEFDEAGGYDSVNSDVYDLINSCIIEAEPYEN